ncbi:MAG: SRPBCC family protein [Gammaproteobacteria bacterium]
MFRTLMICIALTAFVHSAFAHGPSRQKVTKEVVVDAPAVEVWAIIANFCAIADWHPAIHSAQCDPSSGTEIGATRVLTVAEEGGPQIHEELQKFDAEKMTMKYKISKTDNTVLPVTTYSAFLSVADNGDDTSTVKWRGGFYRAYPNNNPPENLNDEAAVTAVTATYEAGLASIKAIAEKSVDK